MFDTSPQNLMREIEAAEKVRDAHLHKRERLIDGYVSSAYSDKVPGSSDQPENHAHEYLSMMIPRTVFDNPRVAVSSRRPRAGKAHSDALQHALNRWIRDTQYRSHLRDVCKDMMFSFGFSMSYPTAIDGKQDPREPGVPHWPTVERLSPARAILDPLALAFRFCRYLGHLWVRDKDGLIAEAEERPDLGWNVSLLREMTTNTDSSKLGRRNDEDELDRNEIVGYDLWIPEAYEDVEDHPGPSEGFHGTIYTLILDQDADGETREDHVRKPYAFYGPRWGPYTMFDVYGVPDSPYPLAPLVATYNQQTELSRQSKSMNTSNAQYKKLVLVDANNKKLQKDLAEAPHHFVVGIPGLGTVENGKGYLEVEIGGVSQSQIEYWSLLKDRLDRSSGISEIHRGNVGEADSATEAAIADDASTVRTDYVKQQFTDAVIREMRTIAWYMADDEQAKFALGSDAAEAQARMIRSSAKYRPEIAMAIQQFEYQHGAALEDTLEPMFQGGSTEDFDFDELELVIEPYSMERTNEALMQQRWMSLVELVIQAAPLIPQTPHVDWEKIFAKGGDVMNDAEFGQVVDTSMASQLMGIPANMQMTGEPTSSTPGQMLPSGPGGQPQGTPGQERGAIQTQQGAPG